MVAPTRLNVTCTLHVLSNCRLSNNILYVAVFYEYGSAHYISHKKLHSFNIYGHRTKLAEYTLMNIE
jgi:hypothetical protein